MSDRVEDLRMDGGAWALLLILSALWGGSFFLFKVLVAELPPLTVVLGRVGMAAVALNLVLLVRQDLMPGSPRLWGAFLMLGLLNNVIPFTLIAFGETHISSGLASILNATTPVFTILVAHVFTGNEKLTWAKGAAVAFGFLGVALLTGPTVFSSLRGGDVVGEASCLTAALTYALGAVYGRRFRGVAPLKIATGQITASTVILAPVALWVDHPWLLAPPSAAAWASWIAIALVNTALAYMIFFRILAVAGATNLILVTFLAPISALALGSAILGEPITAQAIGGMALIGLGLVAIDGRLVRRAALIAGRRAG